MDSDTLLSFQKANNQFIQSRTLEAIQEYSNILLKYQDYDVHLNLAIAKLKVNDFSSALDNIEKAIHLNSERNEASYQKGIALFYLNRPKAALESFVISLQKGFDSKLCQIWLNKCELEIKINGVEKQAEDKLEEPKSEPKIEIPSETKMEEENKDKITVNFGKQKYYWYQTNDILAFEFDATLEKPEKFIYKFSESSLKISYPLSSSNDFLLFILLWNEVVPTTAKITYHESKVELTVEKKNKNINWPLLEKTDQPKTEPVPSYPSSSKNKKDWSRLEKEIEEDFKKDPAEEDALNLLFKNIYRDADENTRRAMIKSYQTSGGTVL